MTQKPTPDRKRAEDKLRRVIDTIPIMAWSVGPDGVVDFLNQRWLDYSGLTLEQYVAEPMRPLHPEDIPRVMERWRVATSVGEPYDDEMRLRRADGEYRWFLVRTVPLRDGQGNIVKWYGTSTDIEDRRRAEEEIRSTKEKLQEREELLATIFEHAPIGIAITDMDARYLRANPRFLEIVGYTAEELYRLTGWDLLYKDDVEANRKLRDELFAGAREDYSWERRYIRKGGEVIWGRNTVTLIRDAAGAPRYAIALVEDVSQRKLVDAAIQATGEKLQALTRRLVELQEDERRDIARELHDRVGQTLTAMRINMDMIRTRLGEHDDPLIRSRNDDSLELIDSAFKAVENVMYELRPPMIDEYGLVAPLQWYARKFAERTGLHVEIRGDEGWRCGPEVELALFRIAQEALNNVARHAQARNAVIELREVGPDIVFTIEDDGVGFDRDTDRAAGRGYGLVTMRERSQAVGGKFEAHFEKGKGTRITVQVPRRK